MGWWGGGKLNALGTSSGKGKTGWVPKLRTAEKEIGDDWTRASRRKQRNLAVGPLGGGGLDLTITMEPKKPSG